MQRPDKPAAVRACAYHPASEQFVSVGGDEDGHYGYVVRENQGRCGLCWPKHTVARASPTSPGRTVVSRAEITLRVLRMGANIAGQRDHGGEAHGPTRREGFEDRT